MQSIYFQKYTTNFSCKIFDPIHISESAIEAIIDDYEKIFSRFLTDSELSIINKQGGGTISEFFQKLLEKNIEAFYLTQGYFHPLVNIEAHGYSGEKKGSIQTLENDIQEIISLHGNTLSLTPGYALDFGGSAKGYLVDLIVEYIQSQGGKNFFINFGGDIYFSGNKGDKLWSAGIEHPFIPEGKLGSISLTNASLSSSGTYKRNWNISGKKYHHILNPKTGMNEQSIIMSSVIADTTFTSDVLATSLISMGWEKAQKFITDTFIDAMIVSHTGEIWVNSDFKETYNFRN